MKKTKQIIIKNELNKDIIINSIDYNISITLLDLEIEKRKLKIKYQKRFLDNLNNNEIFFVDNVLQNLKEDIEEIEYKENKLREQHNYYYCGLDNLEDDDKKKYEELRKKYYFF